MPKLSFDEIDIMLDEANEFDENGESYSARKESNHKLEVKRRLDNYFEHKRLKRALGYEYYDD